MDVFIEQIVKRKWTGRDYLKVFGSIVGGFLLLIALFLLMSSISIQILMMLSTAIIAGVIFLVWYLISNLRVEFEYSVTNGYVVIDKIISRRRRKRLITFESRDVEEMKVYNEAEYAQRTYGKVFRVDADDPQQKTWCMELTHKDFGRTLVVFSPNERTLAAIKPFLKRQVAFHAFSGI